MKENFYYQTSEKIRIDYKIAGMAVRIAAFLVDALVLGAFFAVFYVLILLLLAGSAGVSEWTKSKAPYIVVAVIAGIYGVLFLFYPFIFEWVMKGQTPGKKALRIRAVRDDGSYLTFGAVLLRNLFRIVDMLPVSYVVGLVTMVSNKRRKRVGDFVAATVVVAEPEARLSAVEKFTGENPFDGIVDLAGRFAASDMNLFETYFSSSRDLERPVLERIESELSDLVTRRTGIERPAGLTPAKFIMALYQKLG